MRYLVFLILIPAALFCRQRTYDHLVQHPEITYIPWFTGPLLSPTPINMQPGHPAIEPSITIINTYGEYDSNWKLKSKSNEWSINPFLDFQMGFTNRIGLEILASFISNFKKDQTATRMQDTILLLGFQIANDKKNSWIPDIRIDLQEVIPTGSYQKLNPKKLGIDSTGQGAFQTGPLFIVQKMFYPGNHFLLLKGSIGYLFPSTVHVKGFNAYGGGFKTSGKVHPGQILTSFFTAEYSLSQQWGIGFDASYTYEKKAAFIGSPGFDQNGTPAMVGLPSSSQFSLAPFIEYNFSPMMGILWGSWFTVAGRNSTAFASGYFAYLYVF